MPLVACTFVQTRCTVANAKHPLKQALTTRTIMRKRRSLLYTAWTDVQAGPEERSKFFAPLRHICGEFARRTAAKASWLPMSMAGYCLSGPEASARLRSIQELTYFRYHQVERRCPSVVLAAASTISHRRNVVGWGVKAIDRERPQRSMN